MTERIDEMDPVVELRGRVRDLEKSYVSLDARTSQTEIWQRKFEIADARKEEQFKRIEADLSSIKSNLAWIVKLILGGIAMGVMAFLISGGFRVP